MAPARDRPQTPARAAAHSREHRRPPRRPHAPNQPRLTQDQASTSDSRALHRQAHPQTERPPAIRLSHPARGSSSGRPCPSPPCSRPSSAQAPAPRSGCAPSSARPALPTAGAQQASPPLPRQRATARRSAARAQPTPPQLRSALHRRGPEHRAPRRRHRRRAPPQATARTPPPPSATPGRRPVGRSRRRPQTPSW